MATPIAPRSALLGSVLVSLVACAAPAPRPEATALSTPAPPPSLPAPARPAIATPAPPPGETPIPAPLPEVFESEDFLVTFAKPGDTPESLAARFLGDPGKAWMIEDYNQTTTLTPGQEVVIPRRPWNLAGVEASGYQLVPILVYHNLGSEARGRLILAAKTFEEQMRYLKAQRYRVVSLRDFLEFNALKRQLPKRAVVLTFDDGYRSFLQYAHPLLKELGFTATLFVYTDYVGSRNAVSWEDLRGLQREGFDVQLHSKTHEDMRRKPGESEVDYDRRIRAELVQARILFERQLGQASRILAYPYGSHDEDVVKRLREQGYTAAFDVRRQANPAFTPILTAHRSQIYSEMSLEEFARNLNVFNEERLQ